MLPVTQRNLTVSTLDFYRAQEGWRQRRPIDRALLYVTHGVKVVRRSNSSATAQSLFFNWDDAGGLANVLAKSNEAQILAYDRFINQMGDRANWGINLAELQQSVNMITGRCLQLADFLRHLRRGDLVKAAARLKVPIPKKVTNKKAFADNYLEFHFGWAPLVKDIYDSVNILQSPIKDIVAVGKGMTVIQKPLSVPPFSSGYSGSFRSYAQYKANFAVTNPNLFLANQLGLVNPVVVAWEIVPFSFVVDWFVNVSQFCSIGTDLFGVSLKMPSTTRYTVGAGYFLFRTTPPQEVWASHWRVARDASIVGPSLAFRPQRLWHWRRMAAAASLVVQRFSR